MCSGAHERGARRPAFLDARPQLGRGLAAKPVCGDHLVEDRRDLNRDLLDLVAWIAGKKHALGGVGEDFALDIREDVGADHVQYEGVVVITMVIQGFRGFPRVASVKPVLVIRRNGYPEPSADAAQLARAL